jgi:hypothetical protein
VTGWGIFRRSQTPPLLDSYQEYKPFLRVDFSWRCAYCRITEHRWGSERNFVVEHFRPKGLSEFAHLICAYSNLYYACNRCNDFKGTTWPTAAMKRKGYFFADPCASDVYQEHLKVRKDGRLQTLTKCGEYTRNHLLLDRDLLVTWRAERLDLLRDVKAAERAVATLEKRLMPQVDEHMRQVLQSLIDRHRKLCDRLRREY